MAIKTKVTPQKEEMLEKEGPKTPSDSPLLDLSNAAVRALIRTAKKRGYVTHDQITSLAKEVNSEQIEDVLAMFSEMGVNVVETEEASEEGAEQRRSSRTSPKASANWSKSAWVPAAEAKSRPGAPTTRAHGLARWVGGTLSPGGSPSPSARIRPARSDDRGPVRNPLISAIIIWRDSSTRAASCASSISKRRRVPTPRRCRRRSASRSWFPASRRPSRRRPRPRTRPVQSRW